LQCGHVSDICKLEIQLEETDNNETEVAVYKEAALFIVA
jgi:hypothetical protein